MTDALNAAVDAFEAKTINTVEDTYDVKQRYQDITTKLPLLDDSALRASLLERTDAKEEQFEAVIAQMSDTIALYEKQKAVDDARAREQAEKDAEKKRQELEKETRKNEFLQALTAVEELEYQTPDATRLAQDAISKLSLVAGDPDQPAYSARLDAAIKRISTLPTALEWQKIQAEEEARKAEEESKAAEEVQAQQKQLQAALSHEQFKWNNPDFYGPGGSGSDDK